MTAIWNPVFEWDDHRWRARAACRHTDANLFFPTGSTGSAIDQIQAAKAVCRPCPLQDVSPAPDEGREFYLVLVRDLLYALKMEGTGRAAFVDQLRCGWPIAAAAG